MNNDGVQPLGGIHGVRARSFGDLAQLVSGLHGELSKNPKDPIAVDAQYVHAYQNDRTARVQVSEAAISAAKLFDSAVNEIRKSPAGALIKLEAIGVVADGSLVKHEDVLSVAAVWKDEYPQEVIDVGRAIAGNGSLSDIAQERLMNLAPYCNDKQTMESLAKNPTLNAEAVETLLVRFAEDRYFVAKLADHAGKMGALSIDAANPHVENRWSELSLRIYHADFNRECSVNALVGVRDQSVLMGAALDVASNVGALMKGDKLRAVVRNPATPIEAIEVISKNVHSFMLDRHVRDQLAEAVKQNGKTEQSLDGSIDLNMG